MKYLTAFVLAGVVLTGNVAMAVTVSIGVIGDGTADEYQLDPARQTSLSFVEILAQRSSAAQVFDFGRMTAGGYANNWAKTGARTDQLTAQVDGLAGQVAAGGIHHGMMFSGSENFRAVLAGADASQAARRGIANSAAAVSTLLSADPTFVIAIANVPDVTQTPAARALLARDPAIAPDVEAVRTQIDSYNRTLAFQFASNPRVKLVDAHGIFDALSTGPTIDGVTIDPINPGPSINHLYVDQTHPGTFAQSLLADAFARALGLDDAGSAPPEPAPAPTPDEPTPSPTPVPLPAGAWAALLAMPFVVLMVRRYNRLA